MASTKQNPSMTDVVTPGVALARHQVRRFFTYLQVQGGVIGKTAVLFVYNESRPELSYILTEPLQ